MQVANIQIENIQINGPFSKQMKNKQGQTFESKFYVHKIEGNGKFFTMYRKEEEQIESVGDNVRIEYEEKVNVKDGRRYVNNIAKKVEFSQSQSNDGVSEEEVGEYEPVSHEKAFPDRTIQSPEKHDNISPETAKQLVTAIKAPSGRDLKDVSIEISGLMQALITSGLYEEQGRLHIESLHTDLKNVLDLKRKLVQEYK